MNCAHEDKEGLIEGKLARQRLERVPIADLHELELVLEELRTEETTRRRDVRTRTACGAHPGVRKSVYHSMGPNGSHLTCTYLSTPT